MSQIEEAYMSAVMEKAGIIKPQHYFLCYGFKSSASGLVRADGYFYNTLNRWISK